MLSEALANASEVLHVVQLEIVRSRYRAAIEKPMPPRPQSRPHTDIWYVLGSETCKW